MMEIKEMIIELEEYHESAGFEKYYEKVLKGMPEDERIRHYKETFEQDD